MSKTEEHDEEKLDDSIIYIGVRGSWSAMIYIYRQRDFNLQLIKTWDFQKFVLILCIDRAWGKENTHVMFCASTLKGDPLNQNKIITCGAHLVGWMPGEVMNLAMYV